MTPSDIHADAERGRARSSGVAGGRRVLNCINTEFTFHD